MPVLLRAFAALILLLVGIPARAEHASIANSGAGGPQVGVSRIWLPGGRQMNLLSYGGGGYTYLFDGRLRLGGAGQSSLLSSADGGWVGSSSWGGLSLATDVLGSGSWEFPVGLMVGGGSASVERLLQTGLTERLERESFGFFSTRLFAGAEARVARTLKLALHGALHLGLHGGGESVKEAELSLQLVFLLPRLGY